MLVPLMVTIFQRTIPADRVVVASAIKKSAVHNWPAGFLIGCYRPNICFNSTRLGAWAACRGSGARRSCSIVLDRDGADCGGWRRVRIRG